MDKSEAVEAAAWARSIGLQKVHTRKTLDGYVVTCESPRGGPLHSESLDDLQRWVARWAPGLLAVVPA